MQAIILAGGKGARLRPYTVALPKPLVPIGDYPVLEIVIRQLKQHGFDRITLAVGHLAQLIQAYFGDGGRFGIKLNYSFEDMPLGTAGPVKLIENLESHFLVLNSDDLTDFNYRAFFDFHLQQKAAVSIAMYQRDHKIDFGILTTDENKNLLEYIEKPTYHYQVSMGIYAFSREAVDFIPPNQYYDFPDLIKALLKQKDKVACFEHKGFWLDIGRPGDYEKANEQFEKLKPLLLGAE